MTIDLFPFQREDVEKLTPHTGVLIANEMGTGKTYEAVALDVERRKIAGPTAKTLVVAPLSVLDSWRIHFEELTDLTVQVINPKARELFLKRDVQIYVVHWDVLRLMPELTSMPWLHIVSDECHRAQSRNAQQTKALKKIASTFKTGLSGTPITNTPDKLWSILNWLYPKGRGDQFTPYYTSYWRFFGKFVESIQTPQGYREIKGPKNTDLLHEMIGPYYVRHLKKKRCCKHHPHGVTPELPDKYNSEIYVALEGKQLKAYNSMKKDMLAWIGDHEDKPLAAPVVVAQLVRLQQFACAYAEIDREGKVIMADPSTKLDACMQMLLDNPDEQFVIFSQFAQLIRLLKQRLEKKDIPHGILIGDTPQKFRGKLVNDFQSGRTRVFASTIAAGGVGITLTSANKCIFLDRSWSPALNSQAEDRLHRIGQVAPVQIIDIIARGTVDLGRKQRLEQKWSWIRQVLGDA